MKLRIEHTTRYRYSRPVSLLEHRLMLVPRSGHELRTLSASLHLEPEAAIEWAQDVFGNVVATATISSPARELTIRAVLEVEQCAPAWPVFRIAPRAHSYPFAYSGDELADLGSLLKPQHADPEGAIEAWARGFVLSNPTDTLSLLKDINAGITTAVSYRVRDEEGTQIPSHTLSLASGSCRDMASLFIDAVRHLGFGARAVSGYLFDPDASADDLGSTHAWAEVYLPSAGWIAFDPTHQRVGSASLVPVAVARCNGQIMPVQGGYHGAAEDFLDMDVLVDVRPI